MKGLPAVAEQGAAARRLLFVAALVMVLIEMPSAATCKSRFLAWDDTVLDVLANRIFPEERLAGKALGLMSLLALGALCYPLYVVLYSVWPEGRALVTQVAISDLVGLAVVVPLRYATRRQRPPRRRTHRYLVSWNRFSFPSGHAVRSFAVSVALARSGPVWCVLALPVACAIGLSRITLGRHYPSDVIAGVGIGIVAGLACTMPAMLHLLKV